MTDCDQIYTHYYKLAHVSSINYSIYGAKENVSDQHLLELELQIRNSHPRILLAYYNKCLYHFSFSHWESPELLEEYPIEIRAQASASAEMLANPGRAQKRAENPAEKTAAPEDLAFASLSFLKAVKKSLLYNLSAQKKMHLFGNYVVANVAEQQYGIVQVDPVLLPSGDLVVSLTQRSTLALFPSSVLRVDRIAADIGSFVIYVVPSGLRCHFYDTHNLAQNFSSTPPKSAANLLRLLQLSTGVERSEHDVTWVRLIPNLQHLNNQTSEISQFVHDVDNKKFIVWPWELCILQFGSTEETAPKHVGTENADPFSLINDFMSFCVDVHERESQPVLPRNTHSETNVTVQESFEDGPVSAPASTRSEAKEEKEGPKTVTPVAEDGDGDDDLFGAISESETEEKPELPPDVQDSKHPSSSEASGQVVAAAPYVSIPKEEMIRHKSPMPDSYVDPGAPPPIMPTPIIIQPKPLSANSRELESQGYAFSPIVFNPKIQSSIDTKYGRGGKFFVEREESSGPESESRKSRMRETSVHDIQLEKRDEKDEKRDKSVLFEPQDASDQDYDPDNDEMDSDDESDEDEEFSDLRVSPLKLNSHSGDILNIMVPTEPKAASVPPPSYPSVNPSFSESPSLGHIRNEWRVDSPQASGLQTADHASFMSSPVEAEFDEQKAAEKRPKNGQSGENPEPVPQAAAPNMAESSNCLPLILRSINVFSIPNMFLLRKAQPASSDFNMDFDDDNDDIKASGLSVKRDEIDVFLKWLTTSLVFDMGFNKLGNMRLKMPPNFTGRVVEAATDETVAENIGQDFLTAFPMSYRVTLNELMKEPEKRDELSFLDEISENSELESSLWDSLRPGKPNQNPSRRSHSQNIPKDDNVFALNEVKSTIVKSGNLVNFNFVGLRFWRYLKFSPVSGAKKFQVLMIAENDNCVDYGNVYDSSNSGFLDSLKYNFKENNLGSVKKLHLQSIRADMESVNNGLLLVEKNGGSRDYYTRVNRRLRNLAEMIKLDLITKTNRFEFDRPLLLLFVNFDESMTAVSQISKICRNFSSFLKDRQLPLVQVFSHILPWNFICKRSGNSCSSRYIPELKLSNLALALYNKCPDLHEETVKTETRRLYTQLARTTPTSISFKFLNKENATGSSFQDDLFLHVAYERSVDKRWISAAWSDPLGIVTHTKSWSCARAVGQVIMDIWEVSIDLFVRLKDATSQRTGGSDKKRFLVLTRISSIIPDEELIFWKRLTAKHKEVSLIVLSTSRLPKYLFTSERAKDGFAYVPAFAPTAMQSPGNTSLGSPNQFLNPAFLSPDFAPDAEADVVVRDPRYDISGVVPKMPFPSFNSPTRLGMRIGYLIKSKETDDDKENAKYMVFEVTLLSCSAYWSLNLVMKILLNQYKNLIVLNEILGVCDPDAADDESELRRLVPWHINAVVKTLDYLVHVRVDD